MARKQEDDILYWFTSKGRRIPVREGQSKADALKASLDRVRDTGNSKERQIKQNKEEADNKNQTESTQQFHKSQIEKLSSDKYETGTYNINTLSIIEFDKGYQFTFCQIGDNYSDAEYNALCEGVFAKIGNRNVYAGKFDGTPEISFHTNDKQFAMEFARQHNQRSIWDWSADNGNGAEIDCGGSGDRNKTREELEKEWENN